MEKGYIVPGRALKKLRTARNLKQTVYIYGATGYGKTELIKQYLFNRRYQYISCKERNWKIKGSSTIVVIDDLHLLRHEEERNNILELVRQPDIWLILIGRSSMPTWLISSYVKEGFINITEEDLSLQEEEMMEFFKKEQVPFTEKEIAYVRERSQGNAFIIRHAAMKMKEGICLGEELTTEISDAFADYLENYVMVQWDSEVLEFLLQVSVVGEFTLPLAEMITGDCRVSGLIEKAADSGNFLFCENGVYHLRPVLIKALRRRALKVYGTEKISDFAYNAGLYYEMHDQIVLALIMFEQSGREERIKELLIRNARCNPGNGHYFELRKYYLRLKEEEIEKSIVLMAGISMLYSLLMQEEESEYWYKKLKIFVATAKGGQKREGLSWLSYLDIALPHRGSLNMVAIIKQIPSLLFDKGISLPEFSVTSNCPSILNGGKDFCHWSKIDRKLAVSIGPLMEKVLGRYGKGIVKAALGESLYEKGGEIYEVLTLLTSAQMEAESGGTLEIVFAIIGIQMRLNLSCGECQSAKALLRSFKAKVEKQESFQLFPNIEALQCRVALYERDKKKVEEWIVLAPDEDKEFCILDRYQYLTKVRCYLSLGAYFKAQSLLEKLRYYTKKCQRTYIRMEVNLLSAIAKQRLGWEWREDFFAALKEAEGYHFIRLISEEGVAIQELFTAVGKAYLEKEIVDKEWLAWLIEETGKMAVRYPAYLKHQFAKMPDFCDTALAILRLQAEGMSVNQIAKKLSMKASTVKYHTKENYRKLGVSGKADAVLVAHNLGIL